MEKKEFVLSGSGGQGLILAGIILAESALMDNKNAVQMQSYGPEARGGASKAEVIISEGEINYPKVKASDVLLCLTTASFDKYKKNIKENSLIILDEQVEVKEKIEGAKIVKMPIIQTATELGRTMVANIVALGAIGQITGIVSKESLEEAILKRVPKGTEELNSKAYNAGIKLAKEQREVLYGEVS